MGTKAGIPTFIFYSEKYQQDQIAYLGAYGDTEEREEFMQMARDLVDFNKYKKNIKLFTQIEAFENGRDSNE